MRKTATFVLILIVIIGALFSACGSKNSETVETTTSPTTTTTESTTIIETEIEPAEMWEINWDNVILGPNGFEHQLPDGWFSKVCYNEKCCILLEYSSRQFYKVSINGEYTRLSKDQKIVDYTVAYDTLYWFNLDSEVWKIDWSDDSAVATLYCEDAIAVSPFTDECEGAVVAPEKANWVGYGDLPIYSPYGK